MAALDPDLVALARSYDVETDYVDWRRNRVDVPEQTIVAVLAAMGVDASSPGAVRSALQMRADGERDRVLPATLVVRQGESRDLGAHARTGHRLDAWIDLESGDRRPLTPADDPAPGIRVPADLPLGYHTLHASDDGTNATCALIVTPARLDVVRRFGPKRGWGLATQLYSVRSQQSWGIGDLGDMADLAVWSGQDVGADYLLVNPLHAGEPVPPLEPSPYLPMSRQFFNPLYLRIEDIPEYADLPDSSRRTIDAGRTALHARLDGQDTIDRDAVMAAKRAALHLIYQQPLSASRAHQFEQYCRSQGQALVDFAVWSALAVEFGTEYQRWPEELRNPCGGAVEDFAKAHGEEVRFAMWLQWALDEQLASAQHRAVAAGMRLGLIHDLAVGVHPGGADAWRLHDTYATGIQVGAPPDAFNQMGQNWSQPPWRPDRLAEAGYAPFRDMIRAVLRHAGGVRVDHVIGLFRLWWVPEGRSPRDGTYVYYDHEALVGILALEAHRADAVVVGEDLGVVEPSTREYLGSRGILGTSVLWFERDRKGRPLPAESWRTLCMASVTTHDLPPSAGYLAGDHVRLRERLGLLTRSLDEELASDTAERDSWLEELRARGLLSDVSRSSDDADVHQVVRALHRYLTLSPAHLLCMSLADAVGDRRTQNQPGTTDEYPNWRVPLTGPDGRPVTLERIYGSEYVASMVEVFRHI